ncbi:MAG: c-type cytochrome [Pseudomonadota bacterium]
MKKMLMMCLLALAGCQKEAPDVVAPPAPQAVVVTPAASAPASAPTPAPLPPAVKVETEQSVPKHPVPVKTAVASAPQKVVVAPVPKAVPAVPQVESSAPPAESPKATEPAPAPVANPPVTAAVPQAEALALAKKKNCFACHAIDKKVVGPAWEQVAQRYRGDAGAQARLENKVRQGGKGIWGSIAMPPQALSAEEASLLVRFVLQLQ